MNGISPLLAYAASWMTAMAGVYTLFEKAEDAVNEETRIRLSLWLMDLAPGEYAAKWPGYFASVFDGLFSEKHLSWRCFSRSSLASFIAVTLTYLVLFLNGAVSNTLYGDDGPLLRTTLSVLSILALTIFNVLPDYVSLLQTRYAIRLFQTTRSPLLRVLVLIGDAACSIAILLLFFSAVFIPYFYVKDGDVGSMLAAGGGFVRSLYDLNMGSLFVYSTLLTSIWLWLFSASTLAVAVIQYNEHVYKRLIKILDIDDKPIRSLGFIAMIITTCLFAVAAPFFL